MPRCLDPGADVHLWCEYDAATPEDKRPTFTFRVLSMRDWRVLKEAEAGKRVDAVRSVLTKDIVGWKNVVDREGNAIPFNRDELEDLLSDDDAVDLMEKLGVSSTDKKKLESQPSTNVESSAEAVPVASA